MASGPVWADFVGDTSTTTGTADYALSGTPITGYQAFSVVGNGNSCYYMAVDVDGSGHPLGGREVGRGTYTTSGLVLSRDLILTSTNSGSKVSWAAGTRQLFVVLPAARIDPPASTKTASTYTVTVEDEFILCDCTSNAITVTLLAAANRGGNPLRIKKIDSTANAVTIARAGSNLIDGGTSYVINAQYGAVTLFSDGSANYFVF